MDQINVEFVAGRIRDLRAQAKACEEEAKSLSEQLLEKTHFGVGNHAAGRFLVQVQEVKRFDAATAKKTLGEELFRGICTLQPDTRVAKRVLTGQEYQDCQRVSGTKVLVKEVTDEDV